MERIVAKLDLEQQTKEDKMIEITLKVLVVLGILVACFAIPLSLVMIWEALVKLYKDRK